MRGPEADSPRKRNSRAVLSAVECGVNYVRAFRERPLNSTRWTQREPALAGSPLPGAV